MPNLDPIITFGGAVKALGGGKVGGYLVLYGDESAKDLTGEWFTKDTDFDVDEWPAKTAVYYHHGLDDTLKTRRFTKGEMTVSEDDLGIWVETQLDVRDKYEKAVYKMAEEGKLGWSSGTASHLVEKKDSGEITRWPLGLDASLTPTPCDPRNFATTKMAPMALKALEVPTFAQLSGIKSEGVSSYDKRSILQDCLDRKFREEYPDRYMWAWICEDGLFDTTLVYRLDSKYYEAPYTFDGTTAEIGEGVESVRFTQYKPVSGESKTVSGGLKVADEGKAVLGAAKAYLDRVADIREKRSAKDQDVSPDTLKALGGVGSELEELATQIKAFVNADPPASDTEATKAEFGKQARDAMAFAAKFDVDRLVDSLR